MRDLNNFLAKPYLNKEIPLQKTHDQTNSGRKTSQMHTWANYLKQTKFQEKLEFAGDGACEFPNILSTSEDG